MNNNATPFAMSHGVVNAIDGDEYDDDTAYSLNEYGGDEPTPMDKARIALDEAKGSVGHVLGISEASRLGKYIGSARQTLNMLTLLSYYSTTKVETAQQVLAACRQSNIVMLHAIKASLDNKARLADEQALVEVGHAYQALARAEYEVSSTASYLMQKITARAEREARSITKQAQQAMAELAETLNDER